MLKDNRGALDDFARAERLAPSYAHLFYNRANLLASEGRMRDADRDYSRALDLKVSVLNNIAVFYMLVYITSVRV